MDWEAPPPTERFCESRVALPRLLEPVLMPLWVYLVWGEAPEKWTIVGACLILIGLLIRYVILEQFWRPQPTGEPALQAE